ncbi:hypothetical protein C3F09_07950, partial [candidate division GN15 bacterium]
DVAKSYAQKALALNATYADTWVMLAWCYIEERKYDSALECAKIADGLNPYNTLIRNAMALSYSYLHNTEAAIRIWRDLADRDTSAYDAPYNLARVYLLNGDLVQYEHYLSVAARRSDAPSDLSIELAKCSLRKGDIRSAAVACRQALAKGADSVQVAAFAQTNPQLAQLLGLRR